MKSCILEQVYCQIIDNILMFSNRGFTGKLLLSGILFIIMNVVNTKIYSVRAI